MMEFIFVAVVCISQQCDFVTSNQPITKSHCEKVKKDFLSLPFKSEVTVAAAQCMHFNNGEKV